MNEESSKKYIVVDTETGEIIGELSGIPTQRPVSETKKQRQSKKQSRAGLISIIALSLITVFLIGYVGSKTIFPTQPEPALDPYPYVDGESIPTVPPSSPTLKPSQAPTPAPTFTQAPLLIRSGEIIKHSSRECLAPLTVNTSVGQNYYVYLEYILTDSEKNEGGILIQKLHTHDVSMSFYIIGGQTANVSVPLGQYKIYYATGTTWYGEELKFGNDTHYYRCDDVFDFTEGDDSYLGWTLTLYPVYNGNMDTEIITQNEFPG